MDPLHDVACFDRFARFYDLGSPTVDAAPIRAGLSRADRRIRRVIDLGGGTGRAAAALSAPERVVVDASRGMLRKARGKGLDCVQGNAMGLPLADESADAVVIVDALHHMSGAEAVVAEAARVLRPGGVLVVREFDPATLRGRALGAFEHLLGSESVFHEPDDLARIAGAAGLEAAYLPGHEYTLAAVAPTPGER